MVARERFELSSAAPEAAMFDHCTTGLYGKRLNSEDWDKYFSVKSENKKATQGRYFSFLSVSWMQ
jgi:hypothetical protein